MPSSIRDTVFDAIQLMVKLSSAEDDEIVETLIGQGIPALQAELIVAFVPIALGRVAISRMPAGSSISMPVYALIRNFETGKNLRVDFANVQEYVIGLEIAAQMEPNQLSAAAARSCEVASLKELPAGKLRAGFRFIEPLFCRLGDLPGFPDWYAQVSPPRNTKPWWRLW